MKVLPVLDVMNGAVVRAIAGRRADYRPLVSTLTTATEPLAVADAIHERFGFTEFYVADLDAILHHPTPKLNPLRGRAYKTWLDAGVRTIADVVDAEVIVLGSETLAVSPADIVPGIAPMRLAFSFDLRDGQPIGRTTVDDVIAAGIRRVIVLDLARVGVGSGVGTEPLVRELMGRHADVELYVGGGIRGRDDIERLEQMGVSGVLIASALHVGTF